MIPYALGLGALLGALSGITPWAFVGLLGGLWLPQAARWLGVLAYGLVLIHLGLGKDPWAGQIGQWVKLEGRLKEGFLHTPQGRIYVRYYPRLQEGDYVLEGRLQRPQGQRNPGGFDQATWLKGQGISAVLDAKQVVAYQPAPPGIRDWFQKQLTANLSPPAAALATAMTLGERRDLGETYGEFQKAGLAHALALSGLNVAILAGFFVIVLYKAGHYRYLATLVILLLYLLLVGPQPSLLRAVIMSGLVLVGLYRGKGKAEVLPALALALFIHLAYEPYAIYSLSFQLSYLAVLGMALVLPRLPRLEGWKNWLWASLGVTVAAQVFILPLLLHQFHQLPLISPLSNLLVLPILNLLVPLGFMKLILGGLLAWPVELLSQLTLNLVAWLSRGPQLGWGQLSATGFLLYFLGILPLLGALYRRLPWSKALALSSTVVLAALLPQPFQRPEIWQLDVGQGDASLIRLPGNVEILVDGGRGWAYPRLAGALKALAVDDIDLVVATHPDADHIEALPLLMHDFPVRTLITGPRVKGDSLDDALHQAAKTQGIQVIQAGLGSVLGLAGANLKFLGPRGNEIEDNQRSLVFVLEYKGRKALFTGDAPITSEAGWLPEKVDVLKVGHHGSQSSTGDQLLQGFQPRVALIGVGGNTYGHPTREALQRLNQHGVVIHRTDQEGAIRIQFW